MEYVIPSRGEPIEEINACYSTMLAVWEELAGRFDIPRLLNLRAEAEAICEEIIAPAAHAVDGNAAWPRRIIVRA
ncbi:hypothetical protein AWB76_04872 [Caballeronia temeraria]|uniref:Uncharacterized protein n=1 Tax=Caballeronia temeraria TaxID=1777137 RepID=A0A158BYT1_9BURK|nr:hypothetical protein [Caballeronia temeraria]SAK75223.1 hypothetical protein AWB76_04872 [Caballeronia temeraria]